MTPQQIEAMKLALEALELNNSEWKDLANSGDSGYWKAEDQGHYQLTIEAITAIKEALAQPEQCNYPECKCPTENPCLKGLAQPEQIPPSAYSNTHQPKRHELQAKGEHPAPCARHCEANAFQIVIKNLKAQLAQPEQEPVAWMSSGEARMIHWKSKHPGFGDDWIPLYTKEQL